jgi:hypothetical protein
MNKREINEALIYMTALWPNFRPPSDELEVHVWEVAWADVLGTLELEEVRAAMVYLSRQGREFAPPPGVIYDRCEELRLAEIRQQPVTPVDMEQLRRSPY